MASQFSISSLRSLTAKSPYRTTAFDETSQQEKPLTSEELDIIRRLYTGENPDAEYDPYEPMVEWFTGKGKEEVMPLSAAPEPKRRWIRSKWEKQKVRPTRYTSGTILTPSEDYENRACHPCRPNRPQQTQNHLKIRILFNMVFRSLDIRTACPPCSQNCPPDKRRILQPPRRVPLDRGGEEGMGGKGP